MSKIDDLGENLGINGQEVVFAVGLILLPFVKKVIKNPNNLLNEKNKYTNQINKIANSFEKNSFNWANNDLVNAYVLGLIFADSQAKKLNGIPKTLSKINNATSLFNAIPGINATTTTLLKKQLARYPEHINVLNLIKGQAYQTIKKQKFQILRASNDIYRKIAIMASEKTFKESNIFTRRKLSQQLLDEFSRRGLKTITYRNGSVHSIDNYCEMVGRTMTNNAFRQANLNRYQETGYQLGQVSSHFRACDFCTPYEGVILSLDGKSKNHPSIYDAELQGLFHCNCKHSISPYTEGREELINKISIDPAEQSLINQYGYSEAQQVAYSAQQKQRYNERHIRQYKRLLSTSLSDIDKQKYNIKIREWQQKQRNLINSNTYLKRKYSREQIKTAH